MTKLNLDEIEKRCEAPAFRRRGGGSVQILDYDARADCLALIARVRELEGALQQFADLHDYCHCEEMPDDTPCEVCVAHQLLDGGSE